MNCRTWFQDRKSFTKESASTWQRKGHGSCLRDSPHIDLPRGKRPVEPSLHDAVKALLQTWARIKEKAQMKFSHKLQASTTLSPCTDVFEAQDTSNREVSSLFQQFPLHLSPADFSNVGFFFFNACKLSAVTMFCIKSFHGWTVWSVKKCFLELL